MSSEKQVFEFLCVLYLWTVWFAGLGKVNKVFSIRAGQRAGL